MCNYALNSLTLRELATLLEMGAHSHLANLETGKNMPTAELILKIAELLPFPPIS